MKIKITINTDNAAFQESMNGEAARILRLIAVKLERDEYDIHAGEEQKLRDFNGNIVGELKVTR